MEVRWSAFDKKYLKAYGINIRKVLQSGILRSQSVMKTEKGWIRCVYGVMKGSDMLLIVVKEIDLWK